jgi:hypothetical protein
MGQQEADREAPGETWSASEQIWMATDAENGEGEYAPEPSFRRRMIVVIANSVSVFCAIALVIMAVAIWRGRPPAPVPLAAVAAAPVVVEPPAVPLVAAAAEPTIEMEPEPIAKPTPVRKPGKRVRAAKRIPPQTAVMRSKPKATSTVVAPVVKPAAPAPRAKARYGHF